MFRTFCLKSDDIFLDFSCCFKNILLNCSGSFFRLSSDRNFIIDLPTPKSKKENPTWFLVEVEFVKKFKTFVTLDTLKSNPSFEGMRVLQRGNRLSVMPVEKKHFDKILKIGS